MASIKAEMQALGSEPQTCHRPFERGETMTAIEYDNGESSGWHTDECVKHWKEKGFPKCKE
jgi:hypothetical protein